MRQLRFWALALSVLATGTTFAGSISADLRAAAKRGRIELGQVPGLQHTPLRTITIVEPEITDDGDVYGRAEVGNGLVDAALHPAQSSTDGESAWVLALDLSAGQLSDLIPPLEGTVVDGFSVGRAAIVLSTATVALDGSSLSPRAQTFYGRYFSEPRFLMDLTSGVNALARVSSRDKTAAATALRLLGIRVKDVLLQGCVLEDATYSDLKDAKKNGNLKKRLRETMSLRGYLPGFKIPGLPRSYATGEASLILRGKPGVGVGFRLTAPSKSGAAQIFDCSVDVRAADLGATEVKVVGRARGIWNDALGIQGFDLSDTRLVLSVDNQQKVGFGIRAGLGVGSRELTVAGKFQIHAVTGIPTGGCFEGSLDSIGSKDLVAFANALGKARGKTKKIDESSLQSFELQDLYLRVAPGGDRDLGVSDGFQIKGELHALDRRFAYVDGEVNLDGVVPEIRLQGECGNIDLGALALRDAAVDVKLGASLDQHFRVSGETKILALERAVDVNLGLKSLYFNTSTKLSGIYETEYHFSSPSSSKPAWNVRARFKNDLTRTLEREVSKRASAWSNRARKDFQKTQNKLQAALGEVKRLDQAIESARRTVRAGRKQKEQKLSAAQRKVQSIQGNIDQVRKEIKGKRAKKAKQLASKQKAMDRARSTWKKAIRNRKKAPIHKKPKLKAIEAAKFADFKRKEASYKTALAGYRVLTKVPVDASPRIVSLFAAKKTAEGALKAARKFITTLPVDADPRVASLFAARTTARGALKVAQGAVKVAEKTTTGAANVAAWAARNNGKLLMIDGARFDTKLADFLRGSHVKLESQVRFLGKPKTLRLSIRPADLGKNKLFDSIWKELKRGVDRR